MFRVFNRVVLICFLLLFIWTSGVGASDPRKPIFFITDLEGNGARWDDFVRTSGAFESDWDGRSTPRLKPGVRFVFGGDSIDKGSSGYRILRDLVTLKEQNPDQVTLILGNRDLNKMPLLGLNAMAAEKPEEATKQLQVYLKRINAHEAFENRRVELGRSASDIEVTKSLLADVDEGGVLRRYFERGELGKVIDGTLFVHGSVNEGALGLKDDAQYSLNKKLESLDAWKKKQVELWVKSSGKDGKQLFGYQASENGLIYSRFSNYAPNDRLIAAFAKNGIHRLVVGHTPEGSSPTIFRRFRAGDPLGFEVINADNSAMRDGSAMVVRISGDETSVSGIQQDGGQVDFRLNLTKEDPFIGKFTDSGFLVKGQLRDGRMILYKTGNSENGFSPTTYYVPKEELSLDSSGKIRYKAPESGRPISDAELSEILDTPDDRTRVERLKGLSGKHLTPRQIGRMVEKAGFLKNSFEMGQYIRLAGESESSAWTPALKKWISAWSSGSERWMSFMVKSARYAQDKIRGALFQRCLKQGLTEGLEGQVPPVQ